MRGEQQKVIHKGSGDKVSAFITLLCSIRITDSNSMQLARPETETIS